MIFRIAILLCLIWGAHAIVATDDPTDTEFLSFMSIDPSETFFDSMEETETYIETTETLESTEASETLEPSETETTESSETLESTEASETLEPSETETTESSETLESTEASETLEPSETETTESSETLESTEASETIETTESESDEETEVFDLSSDIFVSDQISFTLTEEISATETLTEVESTTSVQIDPTSTVTVATSVGQLYPFGEDQGDRYFGSEWPQISDTIFFASRVPYGEEGYSIAHVLYNGVMTFGTDRNAYYPSLYYAHQRFQAVVAPFWAYFDWYDDEARVYYHLYQKDVVSSDADEEARKPEILTRATSDVRDFEYSDDFNASSVLVATWHNVRPANWYSWICTYYFYFEGYPWYDELYQTYCVDDLEPELNTFQAVYVTDGETGYLLYLYKEGGITWRFEYWRRIEIGYTNGEDLVDFGVTYTAITTTLDTDVGNTGVPGYYIFKVGEIENPTQKCFDWVAENVELATSASYADDILSLYECPCTLEKLQRQWWWYDYHGDFTPGEETIICYSISTVAKRRLTRLLGNPLNKMCCYSFIPPSSYYWFDWFLAWRNAPYISYGIYQGRILRYDPWYWLSTSRLFLTEDVLPHKWCCIDSDFISGTCPSFYYIRPAATCTQNVVIINARLLGDPHVVTMDGRAYTMNGYGEYILMEFDSEDLGTFMLQGRTERTVGSDGNFTKATVFVAFAVKDSANTSFQAELNATQDGMILTVNGIDITLSFYNNDTFSEVYDDVVGVTKTTAGTRVQAEASFASGVTLKLYPGVQNLEFTITVESGVDLTGLTKGLLGNFNNDSTDDFITSGGINLGNDLTEREIHDDFASTWQVTSLTSVFTYPTGMTALDFQHPEFEPLFREDANQTLLAIAEELCGAGNNTCIFDYLATGDENFAMATLQTDQDNAAEDESLANTAPNVAVIDGQLNANGFFMVENEETHYITVNGSDPDGDEFTFKLRSHSAGADLTINSSSGVITYIANTSFPVAIQVFTEDSNGAISEVINIPILGCTGCSDNGDCDASVTRDEEFLSGSFILFVCNCLPAWTGSECESDVDACDGNPCLDLQNCTDLTPAEQGNNAVGYSCGDCPEGYEEMDQVNACIDVNECNETDTCTNADCLNTEGSFTCECKDGYAESEDDDTVCVDLNECDERLHDCEQLCSNTDGSFDCVCFEGWTLNIAGECEEDPDLSALCAALACSHFCVNDSGAPACACPAGYALLPDNDTHCENIDECNDGAPPCQHICEDLPGSYNCSCRDGFQLTRDGVDCEECEPPYWGANCQSRCACSGRGTCDSQRGCVCTEGWTGENCNVDVNECTEDPNACAPDELCENTLGSYTCTCISGYVLNEYDECEDIDECDSLLTHDCDTALEDCVNNDGSFRCDCRTGFSRDGSGSCVDIDECTQGIHSCDHICDNVPGFYNCRCQFGYRLESDRESCEQIEDVCAAFNLTCEYECTVDTATSTAFCICPRGQGLIGETECEDIDECSLAHLNLCDEQDLCENTNGSYTCGCFSGFRLENDGRSCTECTGQTWGENCENSCACTENAVECDTRVGCICESGYTGVHCEEDIDECNTGGLICSASQECENIPGSARCVCGDGYAAIDNTTCEDVNECESSADNDCNQECTNTPGSYVCSCFDGYEMADDGSCEDVDECDLELDNCAGTCINEDGRFRCGCPTGFSLDSDGSSCSASTECDGGHSCDETCALVDGEEVCFCPLGLELDTSDNQTCNDIDLCGSASCEQHCREANSNTTVECYCNVGYQLNSDGYTCSECPDGKYGDECSETCTCVPLNTEVCDTVDGSCTCKDGWTPGGDCSTDIDECVAATDDCPATSTCQNTEGSFVCICNDGYFKSGNSCIECADNFYGKDCAFVCLCDRGDCNPVNGSCDCETGWEGDICNVDTNECATEPNDCTLENRTNWVCFNTLGSFYCDCASGYDDNGVNCTNIDECSGDHLNECNQHCTDTDGSYICSCDPGYELEGNFTCVDTDECILNPCDQVCTNTESSYYCSCNTGYSLEDDNVTCFVSYEYVFTVTFDTTVSFILDPANPLYDALVDDVEGQITSIISTIVENFVRYIISLIRRGSVIVDGTSIVRDLGNHRGTMVEALIALATSEITIENSTVMPAITVNGTLINITADTDKCAILELINPCPSGSTCTLSGGIATCDDDDDDDLNIPLIVGLSVGIPLLVIIIVLIVVLCYLKNKNKQLARVASTEGHYNENISRPHSGNSNGGLLLNEDK